MDGTRLISKALLVAAILFAGFGLVINAQSAADDRAVLMDLYNATGGPNWKNNNNWGTDSPLADWFGINVNVDGDVTRIRLLGNELSGSLPDTLGNLTSLEELALLSNQLRGPIPDTLGNLTSLVVLGLSINELSGPIPDTLGNLTNLERLYLDQNELSGPIPDTLGNLTSLERLTFFQNQLTGPIPDTLGNLTRVLSLAVSGNQLTGPIPDTLGNLTNVELLFFRDNQLSGPVPASFVNLSNLIRLHIYNNAGLCAPTDAAFQAWLSTLEDFRGDVCAAGAPRPKTPDVVQMTVDDAVRAQGGLSAGGSAVTVDLRTLFEFGDTHGMSVTFLRALGPTAVSYAATSSQSEQLATGVEREELTLTPGVASAIPENGAMVEVTVTATPANDPSAAARAAFAVTVKPATPVPILTLPGLLTLALLLGLGGIWRCRRPVR